MWVVAQNRNSFVNLNNFLGVAVDDDFIIAKYGNNDGTIVLGRYSPKRAEEVLKELIRNIYTEPYYMPEE